MVPMKYIVALCFGIVGLIIATTLRINGKINTPSFLGILAIVLIGGVIIAKIESLEEFSAGNYKAKFKDEMNTYKDTLIDEIKKEVGAQKESIELLTKTAKQVSDKLQNTVDQVSQQEKSINNLIEKADKAEEKLKIAIEMAAPPKLSFLSKKIEKTDSGYTAHLKFKPSKNKSLGVFGFAVKVIDDSGAKIIDFWPIAGSPFVTDAGSKKIAADGKEASLVYQLMTVGYPEVELKVSDSCKVEIEGTNDLEPFILDIP